MKTFKYRWKIKDREIIGIKDCQSQDALREHVGKVGGELIEILSEVDKPMPPPPPEPPKHEISVLTAEPPAKPSEITSTAPVANTPENSLKLYSLSEINASVLLGGPFAGFYLVSKNFKNLHQPQAGRKYLAVGILVTILLFAIIAFIPDRLAKNFRPFILLYVPVLFAYFSRVQGGELKAHFKNGGKRYSGWKAVGPVILSLAISYTVYTGFSFGLFVINEININKVVEQAIQYGKVGNYNEAIQRFNKALELAPDNPLLYYNRGITYNEAGGYDKAIEDFSKYIKLNPNDVSAYKLRAEAYVGIKDYDRVIADCTKAIQLDFNDAYLFDKRAFAYFNKKDYFHALADYSRGIQIDPASAVRYFNRAMVYEARKEYDNVISDCTKSLELDSGFADALFLRGRAYFHKADYDKAWDDVNKAESLKSGVDAQFLEELKKASGREQ